MGAVLPVGSGQFSLRWDQNKTPQTLSSHGTLVEQSSPESAQSEATFCPSVEEWHSGGGGACCWYRLYFFPARIFAHLARCAARIRPLPAADNSRPRPGPLAPFAFCFAPPSSRCSIRANFSISSLTCFVIDSKLMIPSPSFR